ncbi:MAG: glycoside hydrolase family 3 N-terminal domain-containing protein [Solirubrobacteraceae bacterium]
MSRGSLPPGLRARLGRRRLVGSGIVTGALVAVAVLLATSSGGGGPHYVPSGGGTATAITPATLDSGALAARVRLRPGAPFRLAPAAISLAASLPIATQVAQLFMVGVRGQTASKQTVPAGVDWGGIAFERSNFASLDQIATLAGSLSAALRQAGGISPLVAAVQNGGPGTAVPGLPPRSEAVLGQSGDAAAVRIQAKFAGDRLRQLGFNMTLGPLADVDTPGGALSGELFSTDPSVVAALSAAAVAGYTAAKVIAAPGHFPGEGSASADPDQMAAEVGGSLALLEGHDLIPFATLTHAASVIMMSGAVYTAFDAVTPASLLPAAISLLRRQYAFTGVVMSNDLDATLQPTGSDPGVVALEALRAGEDLLFITGGAGELAQAYGAVLTATQHDAGVRRLVHQALVRVLSLKARYGLLG